VFIYGALDTGNVVQGNFIGTDATGTLARGSDDNGITIAGGASNNTIGGTAAGDANVISANGGRGVDIGGSGTTGNLVVGNLIGTNAGGASNLGNAGGGVYIFSGASGNTVGGTAAGAGNTIAFNLAAGVSIQDTATGNSIRGNAIYNNSAIGISLGGTTFVANDSLGHAGPNLLQDYPVLQKATITSGGHLVVSYSVPAADTGATYPLAIDFYLADRTGQGKTFVASDAYSATDLAHGVKSVDLGSAAALGVTPGESLVATATDAAGNTSEFSPLGSNAVTTVQATPTISWSTPSPITYGTALSATQLDATASVPGTFVYTPAAGTVLGAGTYTLMVTFTPTDTTDYTTATDSVVLTVNQATLTVTANNASRVYGQANPAFTYTINGFVNGDTSAVVSGAASLTTSATTSSAPGNYTIVVGLGTLSAANYTFAFQDGTLAVTQDSTTTTLTTSVSTAIVGQQLTFTATVSPVPPGAGTPTGSVDFFDTTTHTDLGSSPLVVVNGVDEATLPTTTLAVGPNSLTATYSGDGNFLTSQGSLSQSVASVFVLNATASATLNLSGNASISVPGAIIVDSNATKALTASGNASVTASSIQMVGGVSVSGNAHLGPNPLTGITAVADPLAGLPVPSGGTSYAAVSVSGNSTLTINPGLYPSISLSGNGKLTMRPGIYVITGGGFSVSGNGTVSGSGVLIYNAGSAFPSGGGTFGAISFSGNTTINLSPPTSGTYAGVLIFQARDNTRALALSGNATSSSGIVYASNAALVLSGNANLPHLAAVVSALSISGGAFQLADGSTSDYVSSTANQILYGTLTVAVQDDTGAGIDPSEMDRLNDALSYLNTALGSFGVNLSWAAPSATADVHVHFASSTPYGGASAGVLGFTTAENDVYLVTGWNYYTGADPTQMGAGQYDFLTLATHELAHTVGLGESGDPNSVMYEYLSPGTARRTFTDGNLSAINTDADRFMKVEVDATRGPAAALPSRLPPSSTVLESAAGSLAVPVPLAPGPMLVTSAGQTLPAPPAGALLGSNGNDVLLGGAGNDLVLGGQARDVLVGGFGQDAPAATSQDVLGSDTPSQERTASVDGRDSNDLALDAWSLHGSAMDDKGADGQVAEPVSDWLFMHEQGTGPLDLALAFQGGAGFGDIG
jgi:hypothetical protein